MVFLTNFRLASSLERASFSPPEDPFLRRSPPSLGAFRGFPPLSNLLYTGGRRPPPKTSFSKIDFFAASTSWSSFSPLSPFLSVHFQIKRVVLKEDPASHDPRRDFPEIFLAPPYTSLSCKTRRPNKNFMKRPSFSSPKRPPLVPFMEPPIFETFPPSEPSSSQMSM